MSLRRSQPTTGEAGVYLELVALGWVVNLDRHALHSREPAGACGMLQRVSVPDLFLNSLFTKRRKEQCAPF